LGGSGLRLDCVTWASCGCCACESTTPNPISNSRTITGEDQLSARRPSAQQRELPGSARTARSRRCVRVEVALEDPPPNSSPGTTLGLCTPRDVGDLDAAAVANPPGLPSVGLDTAGIECCSSLRQRRGAATVVPSAAGCARARQAAASSTGCGSSISIAPIRHDCSRRRAPINERDRAGQSRPIDVFVEMRRARVVRLRETAEAARGPTADKAAGLRRIGAVRESAWWTVAHCCSVAPSQAAVRRSREVDRRRSCTGRTGHAAAGRIGRPQAGVCSSTAREAERDVDPSATSTSKPDSSVVNTSRR